MSQPDLARFKKTVWSHYARHRRDLPWRRSITPYKVIVSEIMLQQTQVPRVIVKFNSFIRRFRSWKSLTHASTKEVLQEWSGLGYNRRALYLKRIAEKVVSDEDYGFLNIPRLADSAAPFLRGNLTQRTLKSQHGIPPRRGGATRSGRGMFELLTNLPGIGPNTAGSILAFAFNIPYPFIETNIRSVFIHSFFPDSKRKINDKKITVLIEKTLEDPLIKKNPREWYSALMDYGTYIKRETENPSRKGAHHVKQKPFKGSNRELRSKILKFIFEKSRIEKEIVRECGARGQLAEQVEKNIESMIKEGFIMRKGKELTIA